MKDLYFSAFFCKLLTSFIENDDGRVDLALYPRIPLIYLNK